jgi:diadenosine tetraphosphate (Ap4A) HIT family hydrolase
LRHTNNIFTLTEQELRDSVFLMRIIYEKIKEKNSSIIGFNIGKNIGKSVRQTVFHAHINRIPKRDGDCKNPKGGACGVIAAKRGY